MRRWHCARSWPRSSRPQFDTVDACVTPVLRLDELVRHPLFA
jgi:hypothetical protein